MGAQLPLMDHPHLQIQPDKEIIIEYIRNEDFKYVRMLGARAACRSHAASWEGGSAGSGAESMEGRTPSPLAVLQGMKRG